MASATPTSALPKSKSNISGTPASPISASSFTLGDIPTPENPTFAHPDHEVPPRSYHGIEDLVIVCCHAIFLPDAEDATFPLQSPHDENNWLLAPFQKSNSKTGKPGEHETFISHIQSGLSALGTGPTRERSLLVFSGAATKRLHTPVSEARSYYHAALAEELYQGRRAGGRAHALFEIGRIQLEENATDSFQNLLFSILLFRKVTGRYPRNVRVITHAFKTKRFLDLHAPTIKWPVERIQVQGIDPIMSSSELDETLSGEDQQGYERWRADPFGMGEFLSQKRIQRGWQNNVVEELAKDLEPSVKDLLYGRTPHNLPWNL